MKMEDIKREKYISLSHIPVSVERTEEILKQMKNCICRIYKGGFKGTGFFCKINLLNSDKNLYLLITNNHVLDENSINIGSTVSLSIGNEEQIKNIKISSDRKKYTDEELDTTIIEIKPKDEISENNFLEVDKDVDQDIESLKNIYENRSIYLLGYPEGMETKVSYGVLDKLYEDRIQHFCSTKDGSSGSPILLSENSKIIGIHFGNPKSENFEFNCGTFILYPLKKFFNTYKDLNEPIINKNNHLEISSRDKAYMNDNENSNFYFPYNSLNVIFHLNKNVNEKDNITKEISGLLQICLLRYIAKKLDNDSINKIKSNELRTIISDYRRHMDLDSDDPQIDIRANLSQRDGKNILNYLNHFQYQYIVKQKDIRDLISLLDFNVQNQVIGYWSQLSKYEGLNELFKRDFLRAIEESYFDYSLIAVSMYQQKGRKKFIEDLNKCDNHVIKLLFHGTQIDPISKIITSGFLYQRKALYGMGVGFSDMLEYASFFSGGDSFENRRSNYGKTLPVGETFSIVGTFVFYDRDKKRDIYDDSYFVKELDHFPTYEEIKQKYADKMVEKNGVHFVQVFLSARRIGKFIGKEYVITEKEQMLPLYGLTLKRNEFLVIWRIPNYIEQKVVSEYLAKMVLSKNENINVYIEDSTEKALELIKRKKYNKIILITSIGLDLSGKKFVDIARKILGFDVMALFLSNNINHIQWIHNYPNALYSDDTNFIEKYINNYNEKGLLDLKAETEKKYKIRLKFTEDFLKFPKFVNIGKYDELIFYEVCPYFRKVIIKNRKTKTALFMKEGGTVEFISYEGKNFDSLLWYITLIDGEMTLFSNNYYLYMDENKKVKGGQYMKRWKYIKKGEQFSFYYENENNILNVSGNQAIINNEKKNDNHLFSLVDDEFSSY